MKVAVVGTGVWGQNHVRILSSLLQVDQVYAYDIDQQRCRQVCAKYGATAVASLAALSGCDAVVIAASSRKHLELGEYFLRHGIAVLIEKPLALNCIDSHKLLQLSLQTNVVLMVGHIEHFNSAFVCFLQLFRSQNMRILAIESQRIGYAPGRDSGDVDVVFDLMIHDLSLLLALFDTKIFACFARSTLIHSAKEHVHACLQTQCGVPINLTASRNSHVCSRVWLIHTTAGSWSLDFKQRTLKQYTHTVVVDDDTQMQSMQENVHTHAIDRQDALQAELNHFLSCATGESDCLVSAELGHKAVNLAHSLQVMCAANVAEKSVDLVSED